jgi:hypothetical protein
MRTTNAMKGEVMECDPYLTRAEAALLMRISARTLGNLATQRKGPPYVRTSAVRGRALYRKSAVVAFLESNAPVGEAMESPAKPAGKGRRRKAATK